MNIVITGSTRGIGSGLAEEFMKCGNNVLINGRSEETTIKIQKKFQGKFPDIICTHFSCDVSDYQSVINMYEYAENKMGSVDIWINNAGINQNNQFIYEIDPQNMNSIIDINIRGMVNGTRIACEKMKNQRGSIYNMEGFGSNNMKAPKMSFYGMTKRALTYFTESVAREMANTDVLIGRLSPGMVITELLLTQMPEKEIEKTRLYKIFNILGDRVETVTPWLVKKILNNKKNNARIAWLTNFKAFRRFAASPFRKRKII